MVGWNVVRRYPWVLLVLFQLLMPRVSLLGHLSGILSGFACQFPYPCFYNHIFAPVPP